MLLRIEERGASDSTVQPNLVAYMTAHYSKEAVETTTGNVDDSDIAGDDARTTEQQQRAPPSRSSSQLGGDLENARHDDQDAARRALAVLDRIETIVGVDATMIRHNAVMDACAKHGEPGMVLEVLDHMMVKSVADGSNGSTTCRPD